MRALRAGSSAMIRARSSGSSRAQPAISGRVRKQPRHRPEGPSTTQTLTQGVTIGADMAALRVAPLDCIKATGSANPESGVGQDLIQFERRDAVAVLTLNRPERLNAMPDLGDGEAFAEVCEAINADPAIRCALITGAGRAFSAGGDLKAMAARSDLFAGSGAEIRERYRRIVHRIARALYGLEVPLIAAVNGPAMGLGCDLVGLADIRLASDRASFGVPFLKLGIVPGDGGAWLLPRNIGYARAAEMLFTAEPIDAATAERWGMVSRVVPHDRLMDEALATADKVAAHAPHALRMTKALLRQGRDVNFDQMLEMTAAMQALAHLTDDHLEGATAALEKRRPRFTGN